MQEQSQKNVKTKEVKENATAYNIVIDDQLQVSGAKVLAETIKISDKDGKDFTDKCEIECTITVNNTGKMLRQEMFLIQQSLFENYQKFSKDCSIINTQEDIYDKN